MFSFFKLYASETIVGRVDGQKFGTNIICENDQVYTIDGDSPAENILFKSCQVDQKCKLEVEFDSKKNITKIIKAEVVLDDDAKSKLKVEDKKSADCSLSKTTVESLLCKNENLNKLDSEMNSLYKNKVSNLNSKEKKEFKTNQKKWIKSVRNICKNEQCLEQVYIKRLQELK